MKKILSFLLCLTITLLLAGCPESKGDPNFRDEAAYDEQDGFAASLTSSYPEFRKKYPEQKNDLCGYIMAQERMPADREVKICFTDVFANGHREAEAMELTPDGIKISDERRIFTFGKHFSVDAVLAMTGFESVDKLFEGVGQVQVYEELGDFCAFTVNHMGKRPEYIDTVYFGKPGSVKCVDINFGELHQPPDPSLQITEKYIYYFAYDYGDVTESSVTVVQIPRDGGEVVMKKIRFSDIGFPDLRNLNFLENVFVDGDYLFMLGDFVVSGEPLQSEFHILGYNLKTDAFDVYKTQDVKGMGKLFRYDGGLGVTTAMYDERGYYSEMGVRFLDFDEESCKLSKNRDLPFAQSENWTYDMSVEGKRFYCIGDTLCGVVSNNDNATMYMYIEVDLKTGAVTTCVPFAKNTKRKNKGLTFGSMLIRDGGLAVSEHNCS